MFEMLLKRYQKPLYGYLIRYTGNPTSAEEIFQETFVKVFEKRHLYQQGRPFKPWLYQIAINTAHDKFRERKFHPLQLEEKDEPMAKVADAPPQHLHRQEVSQMIAEAVAQLPSTQRQVFILREYENLSYAEISDLVQRPLNTVKSDMHRALQTLRSLLDTLADAAMEGEEV
jgi:RNA polymerase sigma-70 factor (ECF subfamily)